MPFEEFATILGVKSKAGHQGCLLIIPFVFSWHDMQLSTSLAYRVPYAHASALHVTFARYFHPGASPIGGWCVLQFSPSNFHAANSWTGWVNEWLSGLASCILSVSKVHCTRCMFRCKSNKVVGYANKSSWRFAKAPPTPPLHHEISLLCLPRR